MQNERDLKDDPIQESSLTRKNKIGWKNNTEEQRVRGDLF